MNSLRAKIDAPYRTKLIATFAAPAIYCNATRYREGDVNEIFAHPGPAHSVVFAGDCGATFSIGLACLWMVHRAIGNLENEELSSASAAFAVFLRAARRTKRSSICRPPSPLTYNVSHGNKWLQVIDEHGNWIYRSPMSRQPSRRSFCHSRRRRSRSYFHLHRGVAYRSARSIEPISVHGTRYTVQTGMTLNKTMNSPLQFPHSYLLLTIAGLIRLLDCGSLDEPQSAQAGGALAAEARPINDRNLGVRLPVPDTKDEISDLSPP